jgi:hypothetical protein
MESLAQVNVMPYQPWHPRVTASPIRLPPVGGGPNNISFSHQIAQQRLLIDGFSFKNSGGRVAQLPHG